MGGPAGMGGPADGQPPAAPNKIQKLKPRDVWDALRNSLKKDEGGQEGKQDV